MEQLSKEYNSFYIANNFNISPTVWNPDSDYIKKADDMTFRGDNAYVWQCQLGDDENVYVNYYKKIRAIDANQYLTKTKEDGSYGCLAFEFDNIKISRDLLDSIAELYYLKYIFPKLENMTLLEIGAGYGRLCKRFGDCFPAAKYYITDAIAESTYFSKIYLGNENKDKIINLPDIENKLPTLNVDIAVNIHSFPECNINDVEWWVRLLHKNRVKYIFYVPNNPNSTPEFMPNNDNKSILDIYTKYGYKVKDFTNIFNKLDIKYSYAVPFFILENGFSS
jgi:putative sugar O-methyltransferase